MPYSFIIKYEHEFGNLEMILGNGNICDHMMDMAEEDVKRNVTDGQWRESA